MLDFDEMLNETRKIQEDDGGSEGDTRSKLIAAFKAAGHAIVGNYKDKRKNSFRYKLGVGDLFAGTSFGSGRREGTSKETAKIRAIVNSVEPSAHIQGYSNWAKWEVTWSEPFAS